MAANDERPSRESRDWDVEAGLELGFGRPPEPASSRTSVMRLLKERFGSARKILLKEEEAAAAPPLGALPRDLAAAQAHSHDGYQIQGEIARGGMGVVLKGHDADLGRDVAIKVLHEALSRRVETVERFLEEAQISGQLQHPGVVPVYELGLLANERPYFTMKLVKGLTLAKLLSERESPHSERRRFLGIFEQVSQTLAYAHSRGVIHRDVKPSNVMVGAFGEVQLLDWGLAKVLRSGGIADERAAAESHASITVVETVRTGSGSTHSQVGSVMGTPAYMAPEQARGEVQRLDERTDVFALGAILCEILTGTPPYAGERDDALHLAAHAKLDDAFVRLASCGAEPELVTLARQCLSPAKQDRPRNAGAVAKVVHDFLEAAEERARLAQIAAAEARVKAEAERRARKLTLALAGTVIVSLVGGAGGYVAYEQHERGRREKLAESIQAHVKEIVYERGRGQLDAALAAVGRAETLATQGEVDAALSAEILEHRRIVESELAERTAAAELATKEARLLARLDRASVLESHEPLDDSSGKRRLHLHRPHETADQWALRDDSYSAAFKEFGVDFGARPDLEVCAVLRATRGPTTIAVFLDDWARVKDRQQNEQGAARLTGIAQDIDPEPWRVLLREAVLSNDKAALLELAGTAKDEEMPALSLFLLGQTLRHLGEIDQAIALLARASLEHPDAFQIHIELAIELRETKPPRDAEAEQHLRAALALRPTSILTCDYLQSLLRTTGRFAEARLVLDRWRGLLDEEEQDRSLLGPLAEVLVRLRDFDGAFDVYRTAVRNAGTDGEFLLELLPDVFNASGREGALRFCTRALEIDSVAARHAMVHVHLQTGQLARALEELERESEDWAADPGWLVEYAVVLGFAGRIEEAIQQSRRAIELAPDSVDAHLWLGKWLLAVQQSDEALGCFRRAAEMAPVNAVAHGLVGDVLLALERFGEASQAYRRALAIQPDHPAVLLGLGMAYLASGQLDDAIEHFEAVPMVGQNGIAAQANCAIALHCLGECRRAEEKLRAVIAGTPPAATIEPFSESASLVVADDPQREKDAATCAKMSVAEGLVRCLSEHRGQHAEAAKVCREALELLRSCPGGRCPVSADHAHAVALEHQMGHVLAKLGERDAAAELFREELKLNPDAECALQTLVKLLPPDGAEQRKLVDDLDQQIEGDPENLQLRRRLATVVGALAEVELAENRDVVALEREILERDPADAETQATLAWLLAIDPESELYDPEPALKLAANAVAIDSEESHFWSRNPSIWAIHSMALYRCGRFKECLEAVQTSVLLKHGFGDWVDNYLLAMAHHRLGNDDEARKWYALAEARSQFGLAEASMDSDSLAREALALFESSDK